MMRTQATLLTRSGVPRLAPIFPTIRDLRKSFKTERITCDASATLGRARRAVLWTFRESDVEQRCARFAQTAALER